jgi:DNA-binding NarL/FixJ family response regulator
VAQKRILLMGMPRLLVDLVTNMIKDDPDWELVISQASLGVLPAEVANAQADIVLIGNDDPMIEPNAVQLWQERPSVPVVVLSPRGDSAAVYELWPRRLLFSDLSPHVLFQVLQRSAGGWSR